MPKKAPTVMAHEAVVSAATTDFSNAMFMSINKALAAGVTRNQLAVLMEDISVFLAEGEVFTARQKRAKSSELGERFNKGRKAGSGSAIRKSLALLLAQDPALKPAAAWRVLSKSPPGGWSFHDNRAGKYIEGPKAGDGMSYPRFQNLVLEVKKLGR